MAIWQKDIPGEGTEFWAILRHKVAKELFCSPSLLSYFLKLSGNKDYFKWADAEIHLTSSE